MSRDYFYGPIDAVCQTLDGRVRRVQVKRHTFDGSLAADTFFSVPAFVRIQGRTWRGYITGRDVDGVAFRPLVKHEFRHYTTQDHTK